MAKIRTRRFEKAEKITANVHYRTLTKQIELIRNSLSRAKYLNDESKKASLEEALTKMESAKLAYKEEFENSQFNLLIDQSAAIIQKLDG